MKNEELTAPNNYWNRELSWVEFNRRVLSEAIDKGIPLLERIKFLSITASNLDEFFMIRVASLKDMVNAGYKKKDIAGMTAAEQLESLSVATHNIVDEQYSTYNNLVKELKKYGIELIDDVTKLSRKQISFIDNYFEEYVYPVLTPMAVDSSRPFPLIRNKTLNIGALVRPMKKGKEEFEFATVQVPGVLPRLLRIPGDGLSFIFLAQIIEKNLNKLFLNHEILATCEFRIMRNADLEIDEEEAADLLKEIEKQIKKRQWGQAIRLELKTDTDERLKEILVRELMISKDEIYDIEGPLDLTFLMKLYGMDEMDPSLKAPVVKPKAVPALVDCADIFEAIRRKDILMHHPYESFEPVVEFVRQASRDPKVLAIKQTLYRVSGNSPIIAALADAAENGKQVTVLVELKARFDEENNIVWAKKLEHAGCHVLYGLVGLKTHSKITLVVRSEEDGIRRYVHLGTGNYNDSTAKLYTDIGMFTCKESYGEDATAVFNMLSGYSEPAGWNRLSVAPLWLKDKFIYLINREKENALNGKSARIIAKMNSLCDPDIIKTLYEASGAGVHIDLIVRGICCLKVGIKGVSENITVRSIVGNYLEHSRIFCFENNGNPEYYCGSADWMPRNLERRVEILFPVEEEELKDRLRYILETELKDNRKAHVLSSDGTYSKVMRPKEIIDSQHIFCVDAEQAIKEVERQNKKDVKATRRFIVKQ